MAKTGAEVHVFEPDSRNYSVLLKRISSLKSEGVENIVLRNAAVAGYDGEAIMYRPGHYDAKSMLGTDGCTILSESRNIGFNVASTVRVVGFARFLLDLPKPVKLVKLDIEGAEWGVLEALENRAFNRFEYMFVETHEWLFPKFQQKTDEMRARY